MGKPSNNSKEALLLKMATLCARSEQAPFDIRKKLGNKGLSVEDSEYVIDELTRRKFIDERRFAGSFARDKVKFASWGKRKIRMALMAKRIPANIIDGALADIEPKEYSAALIRAARAKAAGLNLHSGEDRAKLYRFLLARGFESSLCSRLLQKLISKP